MKKNFIDDLNSNSLGIRLTCAASNSKFVTLRNVEGNLILVDRDFNVVETGCKEITRREATVLYNEYMKNTAFLETPKVKTKKCK